MTMNLPNKLTMLRVLLVPVFMIFACVGQYGTDSFAPVWYLAAFAVFAIASITDYLDGSIARKQNLITDFGKFADPLADKMLTTAAFLCMMRDGVCSLVVLMLIMAREFAVAGLRMVAAGAKGGKVIAANMWGKVKTVLQMVAILVYYLAAALAPASLSGTVMLVTNVLCWLVAAVTLISGVKYLWDNRSYINTAK